jgi:L-ectoine synthase
MIIVRSEDVAGNVGEGSESHLHYTNHLETNYCVAGEGVVVDVATGETFQIRPGTVYALDHHDEHILRATRPRTLITAHTPPPGRPGASRRR